MFFSLSRSGFSSTGIYFYVLHCHSLSRRKVFFFFLLLAVCGIFIPVYNLHLCSFRPHSICPRWGQRVFVLQGVM